MPQFNRNYIAAIAECDVHSWNPSTMHNYRSFRTLDISVAFETGENWNDDNIVIAAWFDNAAYPLEFSETFYFGNSGYVDGISNFPNEIELGQWVARRIIAMREAWIG
jgi:hypothetical protein